MKSILHHLVSRLSSIFRKKETEVIAENGLGGNSKPFAKVEDSPFLEAYFSTFFYSLFGFIQKNCASVFGLAKLSTSNRIRVNALGVLTVFLFFGANELRGQIVTFDFVGLTGSEVSATSNTNNANLATSTITRGAGLSASGNGDRFNATGWATTSIANAVTGNDYMQFTITPNSGFQFSVSSIAMQIQRSGTGLTAVALRSSANGYASNLDAEKAIVDNTSTQTITFTFTQANSTSAVTYRLYGYAEAAGGTGGPGDGTGNDITVNGSVTSTASPVISTTGTLGAVTTTYGTASSETSFNVSGADMAAGILVTPPAGFQVSLASGSGFASSVTVGAAGTIASTPVYVRLAATTAVGTYSGNIVLSSTSATAVNVATASSTVNPVNIPVNGLTANNKPFDGTTTATLSGTPILSGVIPGDVPNVILGGTPVANFATSAVGTGIAVTVTGYTISGSASGNYTLVQPTGLTADITAANIPAITSVLTANATYGVASTTYTITATGTPDSYNATGLPAGLTVNTTNGEISGTPTVVGTFNVTITATNTNGTGNATLVYTIAPKELTITGATADSKIYDRTTTATISGSSLVGIVGADDVTVSNTGTFDTANASTGKAVTSTQTLGGADAAKYTLTLPTGLTADITPKVLTVGSAAAQNKPYDTTNAATITGTLEGVIAPDDVTFNGTGTFATTAVGTGIVVTSTSTLTGADAANYALTQPTGLTADITAVPQFTYGNLVVTRIGTGAAALTNAANPTFLNEYTTTGTAGITVALPTATSGNVNRILSSGTATSEGQLNLSADGQFLTIGGYDAVLGQASVNSTAGIPRVIARVNSVGTVVTSVLTSTTHASGFRSVVTTDGSRYWTAGNGVGVNFNITPRQHYAYCTNYNFFNDNQS